MTVRTYAELINEINTSLPDNVIGQITPSILRSFETDVVDTIFATPFPNVPSTIAVSSAPTSLAAWDSYAHSFTGDNSKIQIGLKYNLISGTAVPSSGSTPYAFAPELSPVVIYMQNAAGANFNTSGNGGRTGVAGLVIEGSHIGQGDFFGSYISLYSGNTRAGASNFLANPAICAVGGPINAGAAGTFLDVVQWETSDNGFDVAMVGFGNTGDRTNDTGALGVAWLGHLPQSTGTKAWDAFYSGLGKTKMGLDLTGITTNASGTWTNAAIVLKVNDRIYFNGTTGTLFAATTGTEFIEGANSGLALVAGNNPSLQVFSNEVAVTVPVAGAGQLQLGTSTDTMKLGGSGMFTSNGTSGTPTLTNLLPSGGHTTIQTWLTIVDSGGATRYIPCY